jgi:poly-gamma-glutamate synthesis protein (capsule biosynthesis protein)
MEETQLPRQQDVVLARAVAEMGVDLVIGHHAHCIQPFEVHAGVPIFYGLGNAIFPDIQTWSNYDHLGHPGEPYRKKQNYWNRRSLAVAYDLETGAFRVDRWESDEKTMRLLRKGVDSPRLEYNPATFAVRFRRHRFFAVWRMKLVNFVRSPRLPHPRHLRSLLNILHEARSGEDEHH